MADGRPHQRPPIWVNSPSERRMRAKQMAVDLQREVELEKAVGLNLDVRLTTAEKAAILEACKPRVRR